MSLSADHLRRTILTALATFPLIGMAATSGPGRESKQVGSRTLVAYFSRTGNTRVVAGLIHRSLHTDLFEIRPAVPYPEDYLATVEQAQQERDSGRERALQARVSSMKEYDTVFLGFPIWRETTPPVIRAFLSAHDLSGRTLIPFITHGGYGLGSRQSGLASHAPRAKLRSPFIMEADQERRTMNSVNEWLNATSLTRISGAS